MSFLTTAIPVYNGEPFITPALQCLVDQERPPDRVVVFDNCSTDGTPAIVESFQKSLPIELRRNEQNIGSAGNLNRCLELAGDTEYLHILLADDLVKPAFYSTLLPLLEPINGRALAYSSYELIDRDGNVFETPFLPTGSTQVRHLSIQAFLEQQASLRNVCCPAVLHKTNRLPSPAFFRTDMPQVADSILYSQWARACEQVVAVEAILCQNRHHPSSATSANVLSVKATVTDEWRAAWTIFDMIEESSFQHWIRREKLRCLFAARTQVKRQLMARLYPGQPVSREIDNVLRELLAFPYRLAGSAAVALRDFVLRAQGQPTKAETLFRIYAHSKKSAQ